MICRLRGKVLEPEVDLAVVLGQVVELVGAQVAVEIDQEQGAGAGRRTLVLTERGPAQDDEILQDRATTHHDVLRGAAQVAHLAAERRQLLRVRLGRVVQPPRPAMAPSGNQLVGTAHSRPWRQAQSR